MAPSRHATDIELDHVHSQARLSFNRTPTLSDTQNAETNPQYEFLAGFRMWSLIVAIMLSMLLLGLDINIVATASDPQVNTHDFLFDLSYLGPPYYLQRLSQSW
jgi:hypothetical protein